MAGSLRKPVSRAEPGSAEPDRGSGPGPGRSVAGPRSGRPVPEPGPGRSIPGPGSGQLARLSPADRPAGRAGTTARPGARSPPPPARPPGPPPRPVPSRPRTCSRPRHSQGLGKVGLSGWAGDQVDGSSGASGHGPGGGGDGGRGAVGQADEADGEVSQGGHDLWCVAGAQPVAVLVEDHVSDPVEAVLDGPMPSGPGGDGLGLGLVHGKGAEPGGPPRRASSP